MYVSCFLSTVKKEKNGNWKTGKLVGRVVLVETSKSAGDRAKRNPQPVIYKHQLKKQETLLVIDYVLPYR